MKRFFIFLFVIFLFIASLKIANAQIVINEMGVLSSPDWIELYAYENVDISGWYLDDVGTSSVIYTFPSETIVGPSTNSFITVDVDNRLNNPGDVIGLYKADKTLVEEIKYGDKGGVCLPANSDGSIGKTTDGGNVVERFSKSTYNTSNAGGILSPCPSPTPPPTSTPIPSSTPNPTDVPTETPHPSPTATPKPTSIPTKRPTATPQDFSSENAQIQEDLLQTNQQDSTATSDAVLGASETNEQHSAIPPFAFVLFGLGLVFIGSSAFIFIRNKKRTS